MTPWSLAGRISPRRRIRVAAADDAGRALNSYPDTAPVSGPAPDRPYAVHLTDNRGRYTLLGFDLDTRHGPVTADLARLHALLDRARLPHVTCASGPGGGRHVWVALAEPVTAVVVAGIARGLAGMLPSLDTAPLLNPRTGALRPPGAPHRSGGTSQVIAGDIRTLLHPTADTSQVLTLAGLIAHDQAIAAAADTAAPSIGTDEHGHPYLPGERRPLPARSQAALTTPLPPGTDASAVLAAVLCGAAPPNAPTLAAPPGHRPTNEGSCSPPAKADWRPTPGSPVTLPASSCRSWSRTPPATGSGSRSSP